MTSLVVIPQAPKPILPPKPVRLFCDDDYTEDRIEIYTDNAFFVVEHCTNVEREEGFDDFWDYARDRHYTKSNGSYSYEAHTTINSVKILIAEGMTSECVMSLLPEVLLSKMKSLIEGLAEQYAKDGDDE